MNRTFILSIAALLCGGYAHAGDIPAGMTEIVLEAHDAGHDGNTGFQWLLDSSHSSFGEMYNRDDFMFFGSYDCFDQRIPEGAEAGNEAGNKVVDGEISILIPAGTYDWIITRPDEWGTYTTSGDFSAVDDFTFLEGESYRIVITERDGSNGMGFYPDLLVDNDIALSSLKLPFSSISLTDKEYVTISITNLGTQAAGGFPVSYTINNLPTVTETFTGSIPAGGTSDFTFATPADFSKPGRYEVKASADMAGDMIPGNNSAMAVTNHLVAYNPPYSVDFSAVPEEFIEEEWFILNNNNEAGWAYSSWKNNKDGNSGAMYCMSGYTSDGDDWLISQPINLKTGKAHVLFSTCTANDERTENVEIWIGKSLDTSKMTRVAEYTLTSSEWGNKAVNFDIAEDGAYFIAFRGVSPSTSYSFFLGDVTIDEGEFVGTPSIRLDGVLAPYSNCDLSAESRIGLKVTNTGTGALNSYTLTATVNGLKYQTQSLTPILPDQTMDVYMNRTFNFSTPGAYEISLALTGDNNTNVTAETVVECFEPITELPVMSNFSKDINTDIWQAMTPHSWTYEEMFQDFSSNSSGKENGLLSRGITFANAARFKVSYTAGGWDNGVIAIYMGLASEDPLQYKRVFYDDQVSNDALEAEFVAPIETPGNYSFIIADEAPKDSRSRLRLNQVDISEVYAHDIALTDAGGSLAPYTPKALADGTQSFTLSVLNRGSEKMTGIKASSLVDGVKNNDSASSIDLEPGESGQLTINVNIPEKRVGDKIELTFSIEGNEEDSFLADNTLTLDPVNVTESILANEAITDLTYGTGTDGSQLFVGYVFNLAHTADLTGMTVGLSTTDDETLANVKGEVAFSVYALNDEGSIERRLWTEKHQRGLGGMIDVDFPDMHLPAGAYYFEVAQLSNYNMGIAYDPEGSVHCYQRDGEQLKRVNYYPLCIRANFAGDAKVYATDASALAFTAPTYSDGLYGNSTTVKAVARNSGYEKAEFKLELSLDGNKVGEQSVTLEPYAEEELAFEGVDLSKEGAHTLTATAIQAGDMNAANNSVDFLINSLAEADPYLMDFENCRDFDAAGDPWNPSWTTIDRNGVTTDLFWRYDHPYRGQPAGFIAFNIKATTPSMEEVPLEGFYPHAGERFGVAFHFDSWADGAEGLEASDVWIMSPKLKLGTDSEFEVYVKTRMLEGSFSELEPYNILISPNGDADFDSFIILGDEERKAAVEEWEKVTVDLSDYDGKEVRVAVQYTGRPRANVCLMIDDLHVKTNLPNAVEEVSDADISVKVSGRDIIAPAGSRVFTADGIETGFKSLDPGLYIVSTPDGSVKVMIR